MKRVALKILIAVLMLIPIQVIAEGKLDSALGAVSANVSTAPASSSQTPSEIGIAANDVMPGNGGRAGYVLSHGNVIPSSEWVYIGAKRGARDRDYTIDYSSGTLFFTEAVRSMDSVRVDYRYSEKGKASRNVTGPGVLPFTLGSNVQMNMVYSYRTADPSLGFGAQDVLTYGLSSVTKFGDSSSISSMMYMATPQTSNRLSLGGNSPTPGVKNKIKKDQLMLQNADLGLGKVKLKLGFQDVGENFAGFSNLRDSKAAATDVLNQLEKEKGLRRMDMAAEIPTGKETGFSFSMGQIKDDNADITSQAFAYSGNAFKFNFYSRDVDTDFTRFNDLKEADRAQMNAERGIKRLRYGMQFVTGIAADGKSVWSGMNMTQLHGENGSLSYTSADLDIGKAKIQADIRTMDPMFNRMLAINDEERTRMALIARRQFNPNAKISDVTADDKASINNESGLNRSTYIVQVDGGPIDTWLSLSNVDSQKGNLNRSSINIDTKRFSLRFSHHSIDKTFDRLNNLQPVERTRFGNEFGMSRTETGGTLKLAGGDASFNHASVVDYQGASVLRDSIEYKNSRLKFRTNFQNIDSRFNRISDLSDSDRSLLVNERGFKRSDYWFNFQATKSINIESYNFQSNNPTAGQTRGQVRNSIQYKPTRGPAITAFQDNYSYMSESGVLSSYVRRKLTFDNTLNILGGIAFKSLSDVNTVQEGDSNPTTTTVFQTHTESNNKARTSFTADTLSVDHGNGQFEDTHQVEIKSLVTKNISALVSYGITDRDANKSEVNGKFGFDWAINKDLKMTMKVANRDGGTKGSQQAREFSINGLLAKRFLLFNDVTVGSASNSNTLMGKQVGLNNAFKISAGFLRGNVMFDNSDRLNPQNGIYYTSRVFKYESDKDPKKWYHLTYFRQNLVTPSGLPAKKRNYAMDLKLTPVTSMTLTSYFGKDGQNGAVLPIGGTVFKISHVLKNGLTVMADYTNDVNDVTYSRARVVGMGFVGTLSNKSAVELYYGYCSLNEGFGTELKNIFRIKYDQKIDADHFITLSAQRKSGVDKTTINPYEGDTTARLEFRTLFD